MGGLVALGEQGPRAEAHYSGAASGKGAVYAWEGNKNVGSGRMEILEATSPSKIVIKLDFFAPFEGHNTAEFTMLPQGDATNVTWAMHGPAPFMSKVMQCSSTRQDGRQGFRGRASPTEEARREISRRSTASRVPRSNDEGQSLSFFNGNCEAALKYYQKVLGARIEAMLPYRRPADMPIPPDWRTRSCTPASRSTARC